jgi:hypothetical protein
MKSKEKERRLSVTDTEAKLIRSFLGVVESIFKYNETTDMYELPVGESVVGYERPVFAEIENIKLKLWKSGIKR